MSADDEDISHTMWTFGFNRFLESIDMLTWVTT